MKKTLKLFDETKHVDSFPLDDDKKFDSEDYFQYSCYRWATDTYPELRGWNLFSYPAGGLRNKTQAQIMKSTGQKAGLPDLFFILRHDFVFFIELKLKGKKPKPKQLECHEHLRSIGFRVYTIDNPKEFKRVINEEMGIWRKNIIK